MILLIHGSVKLIIAIIVIIVIISLTIIVPRKSVLVTSQLLCSFTAKTVYVQRERHASAAFLPDLLTRVSDIFSNLIITFYQKKSFI